MNYKKTKKPAQGQTKGADITAPDSAIKPTPFSSREGLQTFVINEFNNRLVESKEDIAELNDMLKYYKQVVKKSIAKDQVPPTAIIEAITSIQSNIRQIKKNNETLYLNIINRKDLLDFLGKENTQDQSITINVTGFESVQIKNPISRDEVITPDA